MPLGLLVSRTVLDGVTTDLGLGEPTIAFEVAVD